MLWFHTINTSGEPLNEQEMRNSAYTGEWLTDAKLRFSTANGRGVRLALINPDTRDSEPLVSGSWNRQELLEKALFWAGAAEGKTIEEYMLKHQKDSDASELWQYFSQVIEWVRSKFITYNKALKSIDWGSVYEAYVNGELDGNIICKSGHEIHEEIIALMSDDEVTASMKGIYQYIIYGDGKYLSIRKFDEKTARKVYEAQKHFCPYCLKEGNRKEYHFKEMHADHIKPWSLGGKTEEGNCQMLCSTHNQMKGNRW